MPPADDARHLVWSVRPDGTGSQWHDASAGSAVIGELEAGLEYSFAVIAGYTSSSGEVSRWSGFSNNDDIADRVKSGISQALRQDLQSQGRNGEDLT